MKNWTLAMCLLLAITACTPPPNSTLPTSSDLPVVPASYEYLTPNARPKNIILMIGDGMGLTQITAGLYSNGNHYCYDDDT